MYGGKESNVDEHENTFSFGTTNDEWKRLYECFRHSWYAKIMLSKNEAMIFFYRH